MAHSWGPFLHGKRGNARTILALDGGGVRGYISLLIIASLMEAVSDWETNLESDTCPGSRRSFDPQQLRPRDYFDCIYGTSTGGIIATMLGRLSMTATQCLEVYQQVSGEIFGHKRLIGHIPFVTKYSGKNVEAAAKRITKRYCAEHALCSGDDMFAQGGLASPPQHQCETICLTALRGDRCSRKPFLLRTHTNHSENLLAKARYNEGSTGLCIWEVIRATSAAPFYFPPFSTTSNGAHLLFKDGGIRANNPAQVAWNDQSRDLSEPKVLLSVGTGQPQRSNDGFSNKPGGGLLGRLREKIAIIEDVCSNYTNTENTHEALLALVDDEYSRYLRLNPPGVGKIGLDEWKRGIWRDSKTGKERIIPGGSTMSKMEERTEAYLQDCSVISKISQMAKMLVSIRRAREVSRLVS